MFPTPPFPLAGLLPVLASVPNYHSNPITQRVRRKRQRLPPSLLIENASDVFLAFQRTACPRRFRSRLATIRGLSLGGSNRMPNAVTTTDSALFVNLMNWMQAAIIPEYYKNAL